MAAVLVVLSACSDTRPAPNTRLAELGPPDAFSPLSAPADYRVGPSDVLEIAVFPAEALSRTVEVDAAGRIRLPLIGAVDAAGRTPPELSTEIAARLGARYLQSPDVTVAVKEARSLRITLEGALNQPGVYPVVGRTSLLQAVAMAKGADRAADLKRVIVFRRIDHQRTAALFDLAEIQTGRATDPELFGGDVVVVNESGGKRMFYNLVQSSPVLALFRPF